jgi:hypothetical protein
MKWETLQLYHSSSRFMADSLMQQKTFNSPSIKSKSKISHDWQSVGQSVLVSGFHLGPTTTSYFSSYPLERRLSGPQNWSAWFGEVKILDPTGIQIPTLWSTSPHPVPVPIVLPLLLNNRCVSWNTLVSTFGSGYKYKNVIWLTLDMIPIWGNTLTFLAYK